jgi:hypothetical protein
MTRKFVKGEVVKIERAIRKRYLYDDLVGKYARISSVFTTRRAFSNKREYFYFFIKFLNDKKMGNRLLLVYRNEISHVSKKIEEEFLAKELAEKL